MDRVDPPITAWVEDNTPDPKTNWEGWEIVLRKEAPLPPPTVPGAPTLVDVFPTYTSAALVWTPNSDGRSPITRYQLIATPTDGSVGVTTNIDASFNSGNITGLTSGKQYEFNVKAENVIGLSLLSNSILSTLPIQATIPGAPILNIVSPGDTICGLTWTASSDTGSVALIGFRLSAVPAVGAIITANVDDPVATNANVVGLTNGTAYTFSVQAINSEGFSLSSNTIVATPVSAITVPATPVLFSVESQNTRLRFNWSSRYSNSRYRGSNNSIRRQTKSFTIYSLYRESIRCTIS